VADGATTAELAQTLPPDVQLDGELVALSGDGPDFHRLRSRMLHGARGTAVTLFLFDVLAVEGLPPTSLPYAKRREILEELAVEGPHVRTRCDD
jgi:bifunctional non-homologous end joining protein LigD